MKVTSLFVLLREQTLFKTNYVSMRIMPTAQCKKVVFRRAPSHG
ncbi:MAG: hypothetical protein ACLUI3_09885 [Christensenellales bacterium]